MYIMQSLSQFEETTSNSKKAKKPFYSWSGGARNLKTCNISRFCCTVGLNFYEANTTVHCRRNLKRRIQLTIRATRCGIITWLLTNASENSSACRLISTLFHPNMWNDKRKGQMYLQFPILCGYPESGWFIPAMFEEERRVAPTLMNSLLNSRRHGLASYNLGIKAVWQFRFHLGRSRFRNDNSSLLWQ